MMRNSLLCLAIIATSGFSPASSSEFKLLSGHKVRNDHTSDLPNTYISEDELPESWNWGDVEGVSYLTRTLNQHLPQYCGSCWAHGALSALGDRIKIARGTDAGPDINLSIQYILNCGGGMAGSCYGGSHTGVYEFIKSKGFVPYDSCQPYIACSSDTDEGFCGSVDTTCSAANTCRTCNTFSGNGGKCVEITQFPNATVQEYGTYSNDVHAIKAEIFARGPVAAGINAEPILDYAGGIFKDDSEMDKEINHVVSIVGWGKDEETDTSYWIVRNSWGEYWGEMGFVRVEMGKDTLGIEAEIAWATPKAFTLHNFPCTEDGKNCRSKSQKYRDPSYDLAAVARRLQTKSL